MNNKRKNKGITLIALIVTIILLLILAGITISQLTGNGLFEKAKLAKEKTENAQGLENSTLENYEKKIDEAINSKREENNIKFSYDIDSIENGIINLILHIQDNVNGLAKIELKEGNTIILSENKKEEKKIDYEVEIGKEYIIKITSENGDEKEEKILLNINPIMTEKMESNDGNIYKAFATSEYVHNKRYYAYLAFDKNDSTFWYSNGFTNGNGGQAIGYDFGSSVYIYKFILKPRNNGSDTKSVAKYKLQGSNDGDTWEDIETYTNDNPTDGIELVNYVHCNKAYKQYRIEYISTFNGQGTTYASVWELEFYCYQYSDNT